VIEEHFERSRIEGENLGMAKEPSSSQALRVRSEPLPANHFGHAMKPIYQDSSWTQFARPSSERQEDRSSDFLCDRKVGCAPQDVRVNKRKIATEEWLKTVSARFLTKRSQERAVCFFIRDVRGWRIHYRTVMGNSNKPLQ
jgi:hypothetical protein